MRCEFRLTTILNSPTSTYVSSGWFSIRVTEEFLSYFVPRNISKNETQISLWKHINCLWQVFRLPGFSSFFTNKTVKQNVWQIFFSYLFFLILTWAQYYFGSFMIFPIILHRVNCFYLVFRVKKLEQKINTTVERR